MSVTAIQSVHKGGVFAHHSQANTLSFQEKYTNLK
jgi:hypothetical protein